MFELFIIVIIIIALRYFEKKGNSEKFEEENTKRRQQDQVTHQRMRSQARIKAATPSLEDTNSSRSFIIYLYAIELSNWIKVGVTNYCSRSRMESYEQKHRLRANYSSLVQVHVEDCILSPEEFEALVHAQLNALGFSRVLWNSGREFFVIPPVTYSSCQRLDLLIPYLEIVLKVVVTSAYADVGQTRTIAVEQGPHIAKYPVKYSGHLQRPSIYDNYHRLSNSSECVPLSHPGNRLNSADKTYDVATRGEHCGEGIVTSGVMSESQMKLKGQLFLIASEHLLASKLLNQKEEVDDIPFDDVIMPDRRQQPPNYGHNMLVYIN